VSHHVSKATSEIQYYGINDNFPWLMKYRGAAKKLAYRWLNRRSQCRSKNWRQFDAYRDRFPLASPKRLTDLNAMARSR
jgi:RNA-directed DNA polymerase